MFDRMTVESVEPWGTLHRFMMIWNLLISERQTSWSSGVVLRVFCPTPVVSVPVFHLLCRLLYPVVFCSYSLLLLCCCANRKPFRHLPHGRTTYADRERCCSVSPKLNIGFSQRDGFNSDVALGTFTSRWREESKPVMIIWIIRIWEQLVMEGKKMSILKCILELAGPIWDHI